MWSDIVAQPQLGRSTAVQLRGGFLSCFTPFCVCDGKDKERFNSPPSLFFFFHCDPLRLTSSSFHCVSVIGLLDTIAMRRITRQMLNFVYSLKRSPWMTTLFFSRYKITQSGTMAFREGHHHLTIIGRFRRKRNGLNRRKLRATNRKPSRNTGQAAVFTFYGAI